MSKDFWKLALWVLGFTALFLAIAWSATLFTDASLMDAAHPINAIGILVAICVGGVFAYYAMFDALCQSSADVPQASWQRDGTPDSS